MKKNVNGNGKVYVQKNYIENGICNGKRMHGERDDLVVTEYSFELIKMESKMVQRIPGLMEQT